MTSIRLVVIFVAASRFLYRDYKSEEDFCQYIE